MGLTDGLVLHMNLADNAASTTVVAQVGTNGTLLGGDNTSVKAISGPNANITGAFDLNATDDEIDISANSLSFASGSAFSIAGLMEFDGTFGNLVGTTASTSSRLGKATDTTFVITGAGLTTRTYTVPSLGTTNWHLVVATRNTSNQVRLYIDGTESSTGAQTLAETIAPTRVGRGNVGFFDGKLASVSVWNRELSAAEVTQLHNSGSWLAYPWASGVAAEAIRRHVGGL